MIGGTLHEKHFDDFVFGRLLVWTIIFCLIVTKKLLREMHMIMRKHFLK